MKSTRYEIEKEFWKPNFKVYKTTRLQRLLFSMKSVDFFEFGSQVLTVSLTFLAISIMGALLSYITNENMIIVAFSIIFLVLFILSYLLLICSLFLDFIFSQLRFSSLLMKSPLYKFTIPEHCGKYSAQKLENVINHDDFQQDFLQLLDNYEHVDNEDFADVLKSMMNHYDNVHEDLLAEGNLSIKKKHYEDVKFKYKALDELS